MEVHILAVFFIDSKFPGKKMTIMHMAGVRNYYYSLHSAISETFLLGTRFKKIR